jgi:hypothetical protein
MHLNQAQHLPQLTAPTQLQLCFPAGFINSLLNQNLGTNMGSNFVPTQMRAGIATMASAE